jgi:hypothetical protein
MRFTVSVLALSLISTVAFAGDIRAVVADAYGNAIITTQGGAKIIAVGQAELAQSFDDAEIAADEGKFCREVGIVLKGRSYMYGVGDGDPVPSATKIICD